MRLNEPLQGHRLAACIPTREGRPPRRPPQYQQLSGLLSPSSGFSPVRLNTSTFQVCSLQSPPSSFSPAAAEPAHRSPDRQIGEHRISSIPLSATAPLREPRHFMAHFPRGRDDLRVVRKPSPRQKIWKMGLPILDHNRPIRSQFTAGTPSPVSALGPASSKSPRFCVNILHNLTALFRSNQLLRNLRLNSSALPTS